MTKIVDEQGGIITRFGRAMHAMSGVRMVGSAATMGYCAVHLVTTHKFSPMMFGGAVLFGVAVVVTATLLSRRLTS